MRLSYLRNGESLTLDRGRCQGCRQCIEVCPHAVFVLSSGRSSIRDRGACMECGACARNCASGAITVRAGVGCAAAVIGGMLRGTEPSCGGSKAACCGRSNATFGGGDRARAGCG